MSLLALTHVPSSLRATQGARLSALRKAQLRREHALTGLPVAACRNIDETPSTTCKCNPREYSFTLRRGTTRPNTCIDHSRRRSVACGATGVGEAVSGVLTRVGCSPESVFTFSMLAVMPLYWLMMAYPKSMQAWDIARSDAPYVALCIAACVAGFMAWQTGQLAAAWSVLTSCNPASLVPDVVGFAALFKLKWVGTLSWVHLVTLDLYMGREVFVDGVANDIPTQHSLIFCFMMGPVGAAIHWVTKRIVFALRERKSYSRA